MKSLLVKLIGPFFLFYRRRIRRMSHQRLDVERMHRKWALLEKELGTEPASLLDIGCNEGFFTRFAAQKGWLSIGVDFDGQTIRYARKKNISIPNIGFIHEAVSLPFVRKLPTFDVVLLLSVFQEIYVALGREEALKCLGELLSRCRHKLLLETASTNEKYGETLLFTEDNDRTAIVNWVTELVATYPGWQARFIGATEYSNTEPFRYLFAVERTDP